MIVYHGSNSNFKKLRISKSLVKHDSTMDNEGLGIYFSTDRSVAESYGKYIYTLEINDDYFIDFRKKEKCSFYIRRVINTVYKQTGIKINNYFSAADFINRMYWGGQPIFTVGKDIAEILDNTDEFYMEFSEAKRDSIYRILRKIDKECIKVYMFNYHIKNIGVIKTTDENVVRIMSKENRY